MPLHPCMMHRFRIDQRLKKILKCLDVSLGYYFTDILPQKISWNQIEIPDMFHAHIPKAIGCIIDINIKQLGNIL
ncbi:hypothetical protein Thiosp_04194 [Thiorhodovibrio litoralis]|nr:hypothetical protein Thiosp_04194 [Thiorhodovibrio litoralis]